MCSLFPSRFDMLACASFKSFSRDLISLAVDLEVCACVEELLESLRAFSRLLILASSFSVRSVWLEMMSFWADSERVRLLHTAVV